MFGFLSLPLLLFVADLAMLALLILFR